MRSNRYGNSKFYRVFGAVQNGETARMKELEYNDIVDLCKTYEYDQDQITDTVNYYISQGIPITSFYNTLRAPHGVYTISQMRDWLHLIASKGNEWVSFESKCRCLEQLDLPFESLKMLYSYCGIDTIRAVKENISPQQFFYHFLYSFPENSKIATNEDKMIKEICSTISNKETIFRGDTTYFTIQKTVSTSQHRTTFPGVGKMLVERNQILPTYMHYMLDEFYYKNVRKTDYLIPICQLYRDRGFLSVTLCEDILQLVCTTRQDLKGDVADFFLTLADTESNGEADKKYDVAKLNLQQQVKIKKENPYFKYIRWAENEIRLRALNDTVGSPQNISLGAHNVHMLDSIRQKCIQFVMEQTKQYDPLFEQHYSNDKRDKNSFSEEVINYHMNMKAILSYAKQSKDINVQGTLKRILTDNTKLVYSNSTTNEQEYILLPECFERICFIIGNHQYVEELKIRLIEECKEANGTCFSGHINRLFNVFSGIEDRIMLFDMSEECVRIIKVNLQDAVENITEHESIVASSASITSDDIIDQLGKPIEEWNPNIVNYLRTKCEKIKEECWKRMHTHLNKEEYDRLYKTTINTYFGVSIIY